MREEKRLDIFSSAYGETATLKIVQFTSVFTWKLIKDWIVGPRVLVMGYGDGSLAIRIWSLGYEVTVVEGSEAIATRIPAGCRVATSLFENFEPDDEYDTVLGTHVLEHVEDTGRIARRVGGWLARGGKAIFTVPNAHSLHRRIGVLMGLLKFTSELNDSDRAVGHRRVFTPITFREALEDSGFAIERFQGYMLKMLPSAETSQWDPMALDAMFKVSLTLPADMCSNLAAICKRVKG